MGSTSHTTGILWSIGQINPAHEHFMSCLIRQKIISAIERGRETETGEIFILGGAEIYALALPDVDRLELTIVHAEISGDTFFPELDLTEWTLLEDERHEADDRHAYAFSFRIYERAG